LRGVDGDQPFSSATIRTPVAAGPRRSRMSLARMDRPIPPEPAEHPRIRNAMRAARIMRWVSAFVIIVAPLTALVLGATTVWYVGVVIIVIALGALSFGYSLARCPRCGQVWWGNRSGRYTAPSWCDVSVSPPDADETQSFVCRRCRLNLGLALRE
jgi:hypothetical protein